MHGRHSLLRSQDKESDKMSIGGEYSGFAML
jgi:hypothetical protein